MMMNLGSIRRLGPMGLIAMLVALSITLAGSGVGSAAGARDSSRSHDAPNAPNAPNATASHATLTAPVTGTAATGERLRGKFVPRSFAVTDGVLVATGTLKGRVFDGSDVTSFRKQVTMTVLAVDGHAVTPGTARKTAAAFPPAPPAGACNVLNLVLAPLDLNVLGLQVHLDQVVLNIVAQTGAGQLLGNLLCFLAGLLDGGGPLTALLTRIQDLLTQILGALGG